MAMGAGLIAVYVPCACFFILFLGFDSKARTSARPSFAHVRPAAHDLDGHAPGGCLGDLFGLPCLRPAECLRRELWWRGYILPRQELAFGRWTWIIHGLL